MLKFNTPHFSKINISVIVTVTILLVVNFFIDFRFGTNDDASYALLISGATNGIPDKSNIIFIHPYLNFLLGWICSKFPSSKIYSIFILVTYTISMFGLIFLIIKKDFDRYINLICLAAIGILFANLIITLQFTIASILSSSVGVFFLIFRKNTLSKHDYHSLIIPCFFLSMGMLWRPEGFYYSLLILSPFFFLKIWKNTRFIQNLIFIVSTFFIVFYLPIQIFDNSFKNYKEFSVLNKNRASAFEYQPFLNHLPTSDIERFTNDVKKEVGFSRGEFYLANNLIFFDPKKISKENVDKIRSIKLKYNKYNFNFSRSINILKHKYLVLEKNRKLIILPIIFFLMSLFLVNWSRITFSFFLLSIFVFLLIDVLVTIFLKHTDSRVFLPMITILCLLPIISGEAKPNLKMTDFNIFRSIMFFLSIITLLFFSFKTIDYNGNVKEKHKVKSRRGIIETQLKKLEKKNIYLNMSKFRNLRYLEPFKNYNQILLGGNLFLGGVFWLSHDLLQKSCGIELLELCLLDDKRYLIVDQNEKQKIISALIEHYESKFGFKIIIIEPLPNILKLTLK